MRIKFNYLFVLVIVLQSIVLIFLVKKGLDYRSKSANLSELIISLLEQSYNPPAAPKNIYGEAPLYVFDRLQVEWSEFIPNTPKVLNEEQIDKIEYRVVGGFKSAHSDTIGNLSEIIIDEDFLTFPDYGCYNLITTIGSFKVLIIDNKQTDVDKVLKISQWISMNIVTGSEDVFKIQPIPKLNYYKPTWLLNKYSVSTEPLRLNSELSSYFTCYIFDRLGFSGHPVYIETADSAYTMVEVYIDELSKYALVDTSNGVVFLSNDRELMSFRELVDLERGLTEWSVKLLVEKKSPKYPYNLHQIPTFQHSWSSTMFSDKLIDTKQFMETLISESQKVFFYSNFHDGQWKGRTKLEFK